MARIPITQHREPVLSNYCVAPAKRQDGVPWCSLTNMTNPFSMCLIPPWKKRTGIRWKLFILPSRELINICSSWCWRESPNFRKSVSSAVSTSLKISVWTRVMNHCAESPRRKWSVISMNLFPSWPKKTNARMRKWKNVWKHNMTVITSVKICLIFITLSVCWTLLILYKSVTTGSPRARLPFWSGCCSIATSRSMNWWGNIMTHPCLPITKLMWNALFPWFTRVDILLSRITINIPIPICLISPMMKYAEVSLACWPVIISKYREFPFPAGWSVLSVCWMRARQLLSEIPSQLSCPVSHTIRMTVPRLRNWPRSISSTHSISFSVL